jgi:hypothetical protein
MAEKNTDIISDALIDFKAIDEALKANTKEILRSVMKEEIEGYAKESLSDEDEDDYTEDEVETDGSVTGLESGDADDQAEVPAEDELGIDNDNDELGIGGDEDADETPLELDMTAASDDDVIAVYKKMSGGDEIEVVSDNEVKITDPTSGNEYVVKLGGSKKTAVPAIDTDIFGSEDEEGEDENGEEEEDELGESLVYEIELDDDEDEINETDGKEHQVKKSPVAPDMKDNSEGGFKTVKGKGVAIDTVMEESEDEETIEEKIQVGMGNRISNGKTTIVGAGGKAVQANEAYKAKYEALLKENELFRDALKAFRYKLTETVVFNSNLTHVVKLFTEHTTNKSEKQNIIERFDKDVTSLKESKKLYKSIVSELSSKKTVTESVDNKFNKEVTSGKTVIKESTVYSDPSTVRMLDLMRRHENKDKN